MKLEFDETHFQNQRWGRQPGPAHLTLLQKSERAQQALLLLKKTLELHVDVSIAAHPFTKGVLKYQNSRKEAIKATT